MKFIDQQFHRAQSRLRCQGGKAKAVKGQKTAPLFSQPAHGDQAFYEIPAYLRKRIHLNDFDNRCRVFAYMDRVRAHVEGEAA